MTNIILPEDENKEVAQQEEAVAYNSTEEDEERFFLMYHMNIQPSEVERLKPEYRKWLIARFIGQKQMEREAVERQRLMHQLGPNLKV